MEIRKIIPENPKTPYNMQDIIKTVVDNGISSRSRNRSPATWWSDSPA